jgi:fucose permease
LRSRSQPALRSPLAWTLALFSFVYFSLENVVSGWAPIILQRAAGLPLALGAMTISGFWMVSTAARFGAAWRGRHVASRLMLWASVAGCLLGRTLLAVSAAAESSRLGVAAIVLLGAAIGPMLPAILSVVRASFPHNAESVTGLAISAGSIGAMFVPWAFGASIFRLGPLAACLLLLALPLVLAGLLFRVDRKIRDHASPT